ncbi:OadG family transporter subunit [Chloroflexi bacterium]|nr:OadG family transporter subunit [Chloroflexota bacterium]
MNTETLNTALNLTIFGIAISFILLTILIIFITLIKFIENKANKFNLRKNDPNVKKVLAASVAVSVMESELKNYK